MHFSSSAVVAVATLLVLAVTVDARASLVVYKQVQSATPAVGRELPVQITAFNTATEDAAYDVAVDDSQSWPEDSFEMFIGAPTVSWARIPAGGNATHTFVVKPKVSTQYPPRSARLIYRTSQNGPVIAGESSQAFPFEVLSSHNYAKLSSAHVTEWIIFAALAAVPIICPAVVYYYMTSNYDNGIPKN